MHTRFRNRLPAVAVLGLLVASAAILDAQTGVLQNPLGVAESSSQATATASAIPPQDDVAAIAKRQQEVEARIAETQQALARSGQSTTNSPNKQDLAVQLDLLKFLAAVLAQQKSLLEARQDTESQIANLEQQQRLLQSGGLESPPPYSFLELETLRDELAAATQDQSSIEAEIATTRDLCEVVRETLDERERARRAAKERAQQNHPPEDGARLNTKLTLATLSAGVATESVRLHESQLEYKQRMLQANSLLRQNLEQRIELMSGRAEFSQEDLQHVYSRLAQLEDELKQRREATNTELDRINQEWLDAKRRRDESSDKASEAAVAAWQTARSSYQKELSLLNQRVAEVALARYCWECRYRVVAGTASLKERQEWLQDVNEFRERVRRSQQLAELDTNRCHEEIARVQDRLQDARRDSLGEVPWLEFQMESLQHLSATYATSLLHIRRADQLLSRFAQELDETTRPTTTERWLARMPELLRTIWNTELTSVDDKPITVRKVVIGLILLVIGLLISRRSSRTLGHRILPQFGLAPGNAAAIQTIAFYLMFMGFAYFSLETIGVPLTVFAFLGGAVAIGAGFGSQNIMNNFISGLILLLERPIRVGDLINIDGLYGNVAHVGARSTLVRTGSNLEIIVPNSRFLENNVTNLTLSDERIRATVTVGVAYGSPTRRTAELLQQAVSAHPSVLHDHEPIVLFKEFGDNSLNFEVHFWIRMRTVMQGQQVESEIRHTVDDYFRDANITIAFPQRDIHLDTTSPLEVRLQTAESQSLGQFGTGGISRAA